jgi:hypothetical protein
MVYREIIAVFFWELHETHKYTLWAERNNAES